MSPVCLDPSTTAVVILGASEWPDAPQFEPAIQFANSAREFTKFSLAPNGLEIEQDHLLDLFDSGEEQPALVKRIAEFLLELHDRLKKSGRALTDVITFYVGHGGFDTGSNSSYFLAIRKTNPIDYLGSSLSASSLRRASREHAAAARHYLILDCCFAASAVTPYIQMSAAAQAAIAQVQERFPPSGTALLCAAGAAVPAKAKRGATYTMFSEGLLEILLRGAPNVPSNFTMRQLGDAIRSLLTERYQDDAVRPEVHSPEQSKGSVADIPLFKNSQFLVRDQAAAPAESKPQSTRVSDPAAMFIREFQEQDVPPKIYGNQMPVATWVSIPEPVKSLLIEYSRLQQDFMGAFVFAIVSSSALFTHVLLLTLILFERQLFVGTSLLSILLVVGSTCAFACLIWTLFFALILIRGETKIDPRTLRPLTEGSEPWESLAVMEVLRRPRKIHKLGQWSYLHSRVRWHLLVGAIGLLSSPMFWLVLLVAWS
jgi:hypothetical protein